MKVEREAHKISQTVDVSVIIAAWKAQSYIHKAIESALSQTGVTLEVIVVDDASPDETFETVHALTDDDVRLKVVKLDSNGGPSKARNVGIQNSSGRYIAILDADDAFTAEDRLQKLVKIADQEEADIIVDNMIRVNANGQRIDAGNFLECSEYKSRHTIGLKQYVLENVMMSKGPGLGYLKPLINVDSLKKRGVSYDETLRNSEDYYLIADLLADGAKMVFEPFAGYAYQVEEGSISHRLTSELTSKLVDAAKRFDKRHVGKLSRAEKNAVAKYRTRLEHTHVFQQIVECLKMKQVSGVLSALFSRVDAFPFVFNQFFKILSKKISRS